MIVNVGKLHASHSNFMTAHAAMVAAVMYDASGLVIAETILRPGFKPKTGKTQAGTTTRLIRAKDGKVLRVENKLPVATFMERGTKPHIIRARRRKFLRFLQDGQWVFRRSVRHPGTRPYWFLRSATEHAATRMKPMLEAGMSRVSSRRY